MGVVYKAKDTKLKRFVALKFLRSDVLEDEEHRERFLREAQAAAALDHSNICTVHEIDEVEGETFIAMAYLEGQTVKRKVAERPLKLDEALDIAIQTAQGLQAAHEKSIVHRDIKSANLMVTPQGQVKIMDFGLAQLAERSQLTKTETILGTPAYMSPEQAQKQPTDRRTDIWSLAVVVYEMVAGKLPFEGERLEAVLYAIGNEEPEPLTAQRVDVPVELDRIVGKGMAKSPDERYQHVDEMLVDLRAVRKHLRPPAVDAPPVAVKKPMTPAPIRSSAVFMAGLFLVILVASWIYLKRPGSSPADSPVRSLAILPLRPLNAANTDDYLTLGIADTLITKVSQIRGLAVRPTSAIRQYAGKEIDAVTVARELQVEAVLEGTVQRSGDRLRIGMNLLRAHDGLSVWADTFEIRFSDIFAVQDTVAEQVATQLRFRLDENEQAGLARQATTNPEAHEYYLRAMRLFDRRDQIFQAGSRQELEEMIALLKAAVEADPNYALAEAQLAHVYIWMGFFVERTNPVWIQRAKEALARAESLDRNRAEIHVVRHQLLFSVHGGYQLKEAVRELLRAQEIDPSVGRSELASLYAHIGLEEQAFQQIERALEIDPLSDRNRSRFIASCENLGLYDKAVAAQSRFYNRPGPSHALLVKNRLDEAQRLIQSELGRNPDSPRTRGNWALALALRGRFHEAEAEGQKITDLESDRSYHHATFSMAVVYALQGKTKEAVSWLRKTASTGMPNYILFSRNPLLDRIRNDPEFAAFISDVKGQWEVLQEQFP